MREGIKGIIPHIGYRTRLTSPIHMDSKAANPRCQQATSQPSR